MANIAAGLEFMPVGFRFRPTDEELVNHYLTNRLIGETFVLQIIPEIDVCKHEPSDIPAFSKFKSDDPEWFFFSPRDYKYLNSTRSNRATRSGFWKPTGKDREIKFRGSNELIGTKKTLVFYRGRTPNAVKTNWVIHEYQAVAFPADRRTFVLCKLMKKPEKGEERTHALFLDEGEPSNLMASDFEIPTPEGRIPEGNPFSVFSSTFQRQRQADEVDLSSLFSPTVNQPEQGFSILSSPGFNSFTVNQATEEEFNSDEFMNSILADDDEEEVVMNEGMRRAFVHESTPFESVRKVHCESSDTDAEVVSAQYGYIPDSSTRSNTNDGQRECVRYINRIQFYSDQEAKQEKKGISFQDYDFDSSSGDSTPARPLRINPKKVVGSSSTLKTSKTQYQPRTANSVLLRDGPRRSHTRGKISTKDAYPEAEKETPEHSNNNNREAQVTDKRNTLKASSSESSGVNGKSSVIQLEKTPSSSQNLSPPSVYLGNLVIGLILFVFIIWEMLSFGKFC